MGNSAHVFGMFPLPAVSTFSVCADYPEFRDALVRPKLPWTLNLLGALSRPRRADVGRYCVSWDYSAGL